jgi:uncharacterized repeat protein (TIGR03943 family)
MELRERLFRVLTLFAWLAIFFWLLQSQADSETLNMAAFMNPKLWWLISGGLWMTILLILATITKPAASNGCFPWPALGQNLILLIPFLFFPLAKNVNLSSEAFEKRLSTSQLSTVPLKQEEQGLEEEAVKLSIKLGAPPEIINKPIKKIPLSLLMLMPDKYKGKDVEVIGMVLHSEKLEANTFLCMRLVMSCCIADARTVGAGVSHKGLVAPAAESWIRLRGRFTMKSLDDKPFPFIEADSIEVIPEPDNPYLFM